MGGQGGRGVSPIAGCCLARLDCGRRLLGFSIVVVVSYGCCMSFRARPPLDAMVKPFAAFFQKGTAFHSSGQALSRLPAFCQKGLPFNAGRAKGSSVGTASL